MTTTHSIDVEAETRAAIKFAETHFRNENEFTERDLTMVQAGWLAAKRSMSAPASGKIPRESNDALIALARYWKLDGDWMTCKGCKRSLIASRDGEELNHADGCKFADQQHPWTQLRALIVPGGQREVAGCGKLAHGHREDYYLMANARRIGMMSIRQITNTTNWHLAHELFATGSNSAHQICVDAGIDPYGYKVERKPPPTAQSSITTSGARHLAPTPSPGGE